MIFLFASVLLLVIILNLAAASGDFPGEAGVWAVPSQIYLALPWGGVLCVC